MPSETSDQTLVALGRKGDRAAFAELAERHYPLLLSSCRRALGDSELARDAAQQAVLTGMLSIDRLRQTDPRG